MSESSSAKQSARGLAPGKAALTRASILTAGHAFIQTRPFRDLTVGALMEMTPHSRPTFYLYFNDLHALMEALLDGVKAGIVDGARLWLENEGDAVAELQRSIDALVEVGHQHGAILKAVTDAAPGDARLEAVWQSFVRSFDEVVAARIVEDQEAGRTPEFDALPVAQALNRMNASLLITAFGTPDKSDKADVLAAMQTIWLSTLYPFDAGQALGRISP